MKLAHTVGYIVGCFAAGLLKGFQEAFTRQTREPPKAPPRAKEKDPHIYQVRVQGTDGWTEIEATSAERAGEKFVARLLEPSLGRPDFETIIGAEPRRFLDVDDGHLQWHVQVISSIVDEGGVKMLKSEAVSSV